MHHNSRRRELQIKVERAVVMFVTVYAVAMTVYVVFPDATSPLSGPLKIERQGSFFIGGRDVYSRTLASSAEYGIGTVSVDQVYVHYEIPVNRKRSHAITLVHGCCLTGKTWETTPDGRMGWDEYFVRMGYPTYVVDQAYRGRSAGDPSIVESVKSGKRSVDQLPSVFTASREVAWPIFRFGRNYPEVFGGMQFPLEAQPEFWKQIVPDWSTEYAAVNPTIKALSALAKEIGNNIFISHSQSGSYPIEAAVLDQTGIAGIIAIEPVACPYAAGYLRAISKIPMLILFGDYVKTSDRWSPRLKACLEFMELAKKNGADVEVVLLPDVGIHGNSHMIMQDKNNIEVAGWLSAWIEKHVK